MHTYVVHVYVLCITEYSCKYQNVEETHTSIHTSTRSEWLRACIVIHSLSLSLSLSLLQAHIYQHFLPSLTCVSPEGVQNKMTTSFSLAFNIQILY